MENKDPEELLRESKANFKLNLAEIRDAAVEAPSRFVAIGKAGRLNLVVRHGERIKCEFENVAEMNRAICLLVPRLDSTLHVNVAWHGEKGCFERKKNDLTPGTRVAMMVPVNRHLNLNLLLNALRLCRAAVGF